ncbi:MAG TPA: HNH endonuclease, partial [Pedococcus sp.]|nr:HNH endonuclease [Pedococcus sp.]
APTTMVYLTALLPVAQGVAALAALRAAAADRDPGDTRTADQICADVLVERVTGQSKAQAVPIEVQLVMPVDDLFADGPPGAGGAAPRSQGPSPTSGDQTVPQTGAGPSVVEEPAVLGGHVVPSAFARAVLERCVDAGASVWLRRLFTSPDGADLVALDSRRREFSGMLRRFVELRDQTCRTPWCDAPIRHIDHVIQSRNGGDTTVGNGRGTCAACNYAREAPGWSAEVLHEGPQWSGARAAGKEPAAFEQPAGLGPPHTVRLTTPTGHAYDSTAPPILPGRVRARVDELWPVASPLELIFEEWTHAA